MCLIFATLPFSTLYIINKQYPILRKNRSLSIIINGAVCVIYYISCQYLIINLLYEGNTHALSEKLGRHADFLFICGFFISFVYGYILDKMQFTNIGD